MKFRDLTSTCLLEWNESFIVSLEETGVSKKSKVARLVCDGVADDLIMKEVYGSDTAKTKKTFNQTTSSLYKELLTHLLIHHREYPDVWMADLRKLLIAGDEAAFLDKAKKVERVFQDTETFDHQINFYHLLQDHHFQNKYGADAYIEQTQKLRKALDSASDYASIEGHYLSNDIGGRKEKRWDKEILNKHLAFYQEFFGKDRPFKIQIKARLFWLKTMKMNDYFNLTSADSQKLAAEVMELLRKRPFLYFNLPETIEFSNLSYQLYTSSGSLETEEAAKLFDDFFETFNDEWLIKLYPRVIQAIITTYAKFYGDKAGLRFAHDSEPMDPAIEKGLLALLPMVKKIRNRPNLTNEGNRLFGLETEGLVRQHLPGEHRLKAIELFEQIKTQEQQMQNIAGSHLVYANLIHGYYWTEQWALLLEVIEKYRRFVKSRGPLNPMLMKIVDFSELIGQLMLREIELSPEEIQAKSKGIFKDQPGWYDRMVKYSLEYLDLT